MVNTNESCETLESSLTMAIRATKINPMMLRWARERAGYSVREVAMHQRVSSDLIMDWESGKAFPTWRQLEELAYRHYHRSPTLFFMETPPDEEYIDQEFDRLPSAMLADLHPDTLHTVRQARLRQGDLAMLQPPSSSDSGPSIADLSMVAERWTEPDQLVYALHGNLRSSLRRLQSDTGAYLNLSLADFDGFDLGASTTGPKVPVGRTGAFEYCRNLLEETGVWVFLHPFKQKDVNGFCLNHDRFPVIYLNSARNQNERISTIFNQWAHIAFDFNYIDLSNQLRNQMALTGVDRNIEIACRWFAGDPPEASGRLEDRIPSDLMQFDVVRRSTRTPLSQFRWQPNEINQGGEQSGTRPAVAKNSSALGYYAIKKSCLGQRYIRAAFEAFEAERIDEHQLSATLGVKGRHLERLENDALG